MTPVHIGEVCLQLHMLSLLEVLSTITRMCSGIRFVHEWTRCLMYIHLKLVIYIVKQLLFAIVSVFDLMDVPPNPLGSAVPAQDFELLSPISRLSVLLVLVYQLRDTI